MVVSFLHALLMMMRPATTPRGRPAGGRLSSHARARFERRGAARGHATPPAWRCGLTVQKSHRPAVGRLDVTGFEVEAADGSIGKVDESINEAGGSYLIVDTGFWIFGKKSSFPRDLSNVLIATRRSSTSRRRRTRSRTRPSS